MHKPVTESRLGSNIASLYILQGANYLLPLVTLPYLVRVLGPDKYGLIAFTMAFVAYFTVFVDYGFNLTATRDIARCRDNPARVSEIFSTVMLIKLSLMASGFVFMSIIVLIWPVLRQEWALCSVAYLAVTGSVLFPVWFFQGMEEMRSITKISIAARLLVVLAIFSLVRDEGDYILAAGLQASTTVIAGIVSLYIILARADISLLVPGIGQIRQQMADGFHVFASSAAITLYTNSNIFILGLLTNTVIVGYFSAADQIMRAAQGLLTPISQAIYPHISALVDKSREQALSFIHSSFIRVSLLACGLSVFIFVLADELVLLVLGEQYMAAAPILRILAFLPLLIAMSNILGIQTMLTFGMKREFTRIIIWSGMINICLIIPLAIFYAGRGAAASVLITEAIVTAAMAGSLWKNGLAAVIGGKRQWT